MIMMYRDRFNALGRALMSTASIPDAHISVAAPSSGSGNSTTSKATSSKKQASKQVSREPPSAAAPSVVVAATSTATVAATHGVSVASTLSSVAGLAENKAMVPQQVASQPAAAPIVSEDGDSSGEEEVVEEGW